jgi:DHA2 family multidrug resistance protein
VPQFRDEVTRQAASVAYIDDFLLMTYVTLAALPFVLLLRPPRRAPRTAQRQEAEAAVLD